MVHEDGLLVLVCMLHAWEQLSSVGNGCEVEVRHGVLLSLDVDGLLGKAGGWGGSRWAGVLGFYGIRIFFC